MKESTRKDVRGLLRDVGVFQLKLLVDALRDLVMSPIALAAAALDLLLSGQQPPQYFRAMLRTGQRSEAWIDLWAAAYAEDGDRAAGVDDLLLRIEQSLRDPKTGARRARALKRLAERALARQRARAQPGSGDAGEP
jgi:hypothetical protein